MPERKIGDMSEEQLRTFIREEVHKALAEASIEPGRDTVEALLQRIRSGAYIPHNLKYKGAVDNPDLPAWARNGQWS